MRNLIWHPSAWEDYLYWQAQDKKTLKRINLIIADILRNGTDGIGKPEPLKGDLSGLWSREINKKDRVVYRVTETTAEIAECRTHYGNK
jgi:toxin YoeB